MSGVRSLIWFQIFKDLSRPVVSCELSYIIFDASAKLRDIKPVIEDMCYESP